ncbi:MAG: anthranilate synthase component I family protein, partial [Dehalococcoidia bacterium]
MELPLAIAPPAQPAAPLVERLEGAANLTTLFARLRSAPYPLLLDSAMPHAHLGRYSYLTADPFLILRCRGRCIYLERDGQREEAEGDPLALLQDLLRRFATPYLPGLPPFQGGVAGYMGYDLGRLLEQLPVLAADDLELPDLCLAFYDWALVHDGLAGRSWLIATGLPQGTADGARRRLRWARQRLAEPLATKEGPEARVEGPPLRSTFTREGYLAAVQRIKDYLAAGEIYQANLSQRFMLPFAGDPWPLYLRLRQVNPAPFAAYLEFPEVTVLSASPEEFLRVEGRWVETRPIKGTRPRGGTSEEDAALAQELLASEKERAENIMIVDVLRNDLGRVCRVGSVQAPSLLALEQHPTVHHLVSTITGELSEGVDTVDLLRACFPGGSITGAPKIRAMKIIEELE